MLAVLGCVIIWVLAQIYARIIGLGAVPVLTWVAYQFPGLGSTLFKSLQPGLEVVK
jgi:hypothetical protein